MDNYDRLILKMQQIRPTNMVLHGSASNHKLSDVHRYKEAANQYIITNRRSDCQSHNRQLKKIWSMSSTTELGDKQGNCMIYLSAVYRSS